MSIRKDRDGLKITGYGTVSFKNPPGGGFPDGYNAELHRDMWGETCTICRRLFNDHSPEEFLAHWDEIAVRARKQAAEKAKEEK